MDSNTNRKPEIRNLKKKNKFLTDKFR